MTATAGQSGDRRPPDARPAADWRQAMAGHAQTPVPLRAFGLGLLAAIASGLAWGAIAHAARVEVGFAALGIGLAVGYATHLGAGRRAGLPLQATAIAVAVFGFLVGKFLAVYLDVREYMGTLPPEEQAADGFLFAMSILKTFVTQPQLWFGAYDALWIGLAAVAAWRILDPRRRAGRA